MQVIYTSYIWRACSRSEGIQTDGTDLRSDSNVSNQSTHLPGPCRSILEAYCLTARWGIYCGKYHGAVKHTGVVYKSALPTTP